MNLFAEIQDDILGDRPTSAILRKARVLAHRLKNQEFSSWVEFELNGYVDAATLPNYRKITSQIFGDFVSTTRRITNAPVPLNNFPKEWRENFKKLEAAINIGDGVVKIEADINAADTARKNELKEPLPPSIFKYFSHRVYPNMNCLDAWRVISRQQLIQILETVRDRLQKFTLELSVLYPDFSKTDFANNPSISHKQIGHMVQIIILGDNSTFEGSINIESKEGDMTVFDQRNQTVGYQYNAAGNINFDSVRDRVELIAELEKLKLELTQAVRAKAISDEIATKAELKLTKAIQLAQEPEPNKKTIMKYINEAKTVLSDISSVAGLVMALIKVGELVSRFF
ncbi:MAG: hypothetical protein IT313_08020 [Anaerolineales bacterium]|nr:hypothetical protein [Anaerolineales bacterium]